MTTQLTTYIKKDPVRGWTATTELDLEDSKVLTIRTSKLNGRLVTNASVGVRDGDFISHRLYEDFCRRMSVTGLRCTQKNVETQHQDVLDDLLEDIKRLVTAYYAKESK